MARTEPMTEAEMREFIAHYDPSNGKMSALMFSAIAAYVEARARAERHEWNYQVRTKYSTTADPRHDWTIKDFERNVARRIGLELE